MKRRPEARLLICVLAALLGACVEDKPTGCCVDPSWTHEWRVENYSGDSLEVFVKFVDFSSARRVVLGYDDAQILLRRTYFLGGPPNIGRVGCVSVYTMDGVLRYQQKPGAADRWVRRDVGTYEIQMTLRIEGPDLSQDPVADQCLLRAIPFIDVRSSRP